MDKKIINLIIHKRVDGRLTTHLLFFFIHIGGILSEFKHKG